MDTLEQNLERALEAANKNIDMIQHSQNNVNQAAQALRNLEDKACDALFKREDLLDAVGSATENVIYAEQQRNGSDDNVKNIDDARNVLDEARREFENCPGSYTYDERIKEAQETLYREICNNDADAERERAGKLLVKSIQDRISQASGGGTKKS
jgi:hypothetical protein